MLTIVPRMPDNIVVINEGDIFGPYKCSVDCNPPCVVSWTFLNLTGSVSVKTHGGVFAATNSQQKPQIGQVYSGMGNQYNQRGSFSP